MKTQLISNPFMTLMLALAAQPRRVNHASSGLAQPGLAPLLPVIRLLIFCSKKKEQANQGQRFHLSHAGPVMDSRLDAIW